MNATQNLWFTGEELEALATELELEHEDYERLANFVWHCFGYNQATHTKETAIREQLEGLIESEKECYFGTFYTPAEFAEHYFENYAENTIPDWVVVDWEATWDRNLRHDFFFEDGTVWANLY